MYYLNYFIIFSILGHFLESFFYSNGDSGIFLGYWTPIYGIGVVIILLLNNWIKKFNLNKILNILYLFLFSSIILSITEAIGGYLIKWIFDVELWDYINHSFNIGKYTSLEMALIWGLSSILLIYFLKPLFDKFINKMPKLLAYILIGVFILDIIITLIIKVI